MLIGGAGPLADRLREAAPPGYPRDPGGWLGGAGASSASRR